MKQYFPSGLVRILALAGVVLLMPAAPADAASWQWSTQAGRERLVLNLDGARQEKSTGRTAGTELTVSLGAPPASLARSGAAPSPGSLISGVNAEGANVRVQLRDAAFGYIVSRPTARRVIIDVFPDPLGTRWRSPGTPAPASAPSRAASAQPEAPVVPAPKRTPETAAPAGRPAATSGAASAPAASGNPVPPATVDAAENRSRPGPTGPTERIPIPTPGRSPAGDNATVIGRMAAAGSARSTPPADSTAASGAETVTAASPSVPLSPLLPWQGPPPERARGGDEPSASAAERERRALESPAASGRNPAAGDADNSVTGTFSPPPPSVNDIAALTARIETLPPSPDDTAFAWPELRHPVASGTVPPAGTGPAKAQGPAPGSAERAALERSLNRGKPAASVPRPAIPSGTPAGRTPPTGGTRPHAAEKEARNGTESPQQAAGLADVGAVRGKIGGAPPGVDETASGKGTDPARRSPAREANAEGTASVVQPPARNAGAPDVAFTERSLGRSDAVSIALGPDRGEALPGTGAAAPGSTGGPEGDWSHVLAPNALRAQINPKGPDSWPENEALSTLGTAPPAQEKKAEETTAPAETRERMAEAPPAPQPEIIYVDEQGNQIPKPPDSAAMIADARKLVEDKQSREALDLLQTIKAQALTPEQREDVLYLISQATEELYRDNWLQGYEPIVAATSEAMNFNLRSPRVADALMRLGMINLRTGNQGEAEGYFGALKNQFPLKPDVPVGYLALGRDQFGKGQYAEAVRTFQLILDKYPESGAVRDASRYMAEALYKQGHDSRALILVDFVNRRWPRLYLEDTDYLSMVGDLLYRQKRMDDALQTYWTYYNLIPDNPRNDDVLLRIGTVYMRTGFPKGAQDVFNELLRKYPRSASAAVALRRLGENGIYDGNPTLEELFAMFARPSPTSPDIYYRKILEEHPDDPEAAVAALRLAAWRFWNKEPAPAMAMAGDFLKKYPNSPYGPRAEELIRRGFDRELALALEEENYDRILTLWDRYPQAREAHPTLSDDLRVALARAHLNRGEEDEGMDMLTPFLERPKDPKYGEYVYNLFLARALRKEDWNGILDLGEKVARWELPVSVRAQLDYARAISAENLGLASKALPIWRSLYKRDDIPLYQKAYATYFMARDAERRRDLNAAYQLNLDTLKLFTQLQDERSDKADPERVRESLAALMDVTEVMNRFAESLDWADKYAAFVPPNSPDYAAWQFRVARLHRKMGDLGRWKSILDEIVAREPDSVYGRMASSELHTQEVARDLTRFTPGG